MSWIDGAKAVARGLFMRKTEEAELDDEMRFHLEMEARKLMREGHTEQEAHRLAHVRFGGPERMKERTRDERGTRWLDDFTGDVRLGWRSLRRSPEFTLTAMLTLALGIGATTAVFTLIDGVLLAPLPYDRPEELVELRELGSGRVFYLSYPNFDDWRDQARSLDGLIAVMSYDERPVLGAGDPVVLPVVGVSRDFLSVLGVSPVAGRDFTSEENGLGGPNVTLISHALWQSRFGGEEDLRQLTFTVFGERYQVVGVLPPRFRFLYDADVYIPMERWPGTVRSAHAYRAVGRLAQGTSVEMAKRELDAIAGTISEAYPGESQAETVRVRRLSDELLGDQRRPLLLLLGAAALVLLVACTNVASMLLARGTARSAEFAVRASLGAQRGRLVRQMLTEGLLLTVIGGALGLGLAVLAVHMAASSDPGVLPRLQEISIDVRSLAFAAFVALGTALLFGLYPAVRLSRTPIGGTLRAASGRGGSGRRGAIWSGFVAAESGLAVVLLVGAGLLVRSLLAIVTLDAGWDPAPTVEMSVTLPSSAFASEDEALTFIRRLQEEIAGVPGVGTVGLGTFTPLDAGAMTAPAREAGTEPRMDNYTGWRLTDGAYFTALGMRLVSGRLFEPRDTDVTVINQSLARVLFGDEDPIGRRVISNYNGQGTPSQVIGVVADARHWEWGEGSQPEMYVPWWNHVDHLAASVSLMIRTSGDPAAVIVPARARLRDLNAQVPSSFTPMRTAIGASVADRAFVMWILVGFGAIGLLLAAIGIIGVVSYSVAHRRREIGIRLALGAHGSRVRAQVRGEALRSVSLGVAIGIATAFGLAGLVQGLLYDVPARDPMTFLGVALLVLAAATLASDLPARRTVGIPPSEALRE